MSETSTLPLPADTDATPTGVGPFYEVIGGKVVEPPEMGAFETVFATLMTKAIFGVYANLDQIGRMAGETLFQLKPRPRLQRRPDLAFVSYERWPRNKPFPTTASWHVVPDLAVEVVSPNDLAVEILEKIDDYFRAGVRQVWVVYPRHGRFLIYTTPKTITVLDAADTLEGGDVLPGFRLRLADLFDEAAGTAP